MNDPYSTPEELSRLAEAGSWAHRLAARLVGDAHLAEDVVQDAYLAALQNTTQPHSVAAWFSGTVKNLSRRRLRDRSQDDHRERVAAKSEAVPESSETPARLEQQQLLIHALLALDEPYRSHVLARYVDEIPPREIAKREGVPISTVNTRLARGLDRLRASLKSAHGGDTTRWIAAFAPLLKPPVAVKGPWLLGIPLMKKPLVAAVAILFLPLALFVSSLLGADEINPLTDNSVRAQLTQVSPEQTQSLQADIAIDDSPSEVREEDSSASVEPPTPVRTQSLRLIDARTEKGLAYCEVFVLSAEEWSEIELGPGGLGEAQDYPVGTRNLIRKMARSYRANSQGRLTIPMPDDQLYLLASNDELHLVDLVLWSPDEQVLELAPDQLLTVRVVDPQGQGVNGVPVAILAVLDAQELPLARSLSTTKDGTDGWATLALTGDPAGDVSERMVVSLDFPLEERVIVPVYRSQWPDEAVILEMPYVGSVRVDAHDSTSGEHLLNHRSLIRATPEEGFAWFFGPQSLSARLEEGGARFWPVGLGLDLSASVWLQDDQLPTSQSFSGPVVSGQEIRLEMRIGGHLIAFRGQVLEHDGTPAELDSVQIQVGDTSAPLHVELDAEGHFQIDLMEYQDRPFRGIATITEYSTHPAREAIAAIKIDQGSASCDLGSLRLPVSESPPGEAGDRISGRVLDIDGNRMDRVSVRWVQPMGSETGTRAWRSCGVGQGQTDKQGVFMISAERPHADARLQAVDHKGLYHEPEIVERAERDDKGYVLLRMQTGAALTGTLAAVGGLDFSKLELGLWNLAGGAAFGRADVYGWRNALCEPDGSFQFRGLAPGRYTFRAGIGEDHSLAKLLDDVVLQVGENRDPRLDPLDLSGLFRVFDLLVVDERGLPMRATVYSFTEGYRDGQRRILGPERIGSTGAGALLLGADPEYALIIQAHEYFPVLIDPLDPPEKVVLSRGRRIELDWTGSVALKDLPAKLELEIVPIERPAVVDRATRYLQTWSPGRVYLDPNGVTESRVQANGAYRLVWSIDYEYRSGYHMNRVIDLPEQQILSVGADLDLYQVALDKAVLEREIEWLRQRFAASVKGGHIPEDLPFGDMLSE
ncbi:MAG: RNA polymerase sigma factor (sigma-70 family) [Planctomycetota bacterium]|jgi:RNA polymerase sigma factor (sigma-70 family)